ncbi:MAG: regulatory protein RecX [Bacteroidota bacterium]|nr:regulatory protein RecX [Bacteroidota bacterium]
MKTSTSISEKQALEKLMQLCGRQEKCKADIRQKLRQWHIRDEVAEKIINQLEKENFIDETRFALAFCRDKVLFNKWGKIKIGYNLKMKGISETNISNSFSEINEKEYLAMIRKEILEKTRNTKAKSDWERKGKIMQFAQSRGYESDIVADILDGI